MISQGNGQKVSFVFYYFIREKTNIKSGDYLIGDSLRMRTDNLTKYSKNWLLCAIGPFYISEVPDAILYRFYSKIIGMMKSP